MRIFSGVCGAVVGGALAALLALAGAVAQTPAPSSAGETAGQAALERGLSAYQAGRQDGAIAALIEAAAKGDASARFIAEFYLARIYAEGVGPAADHTKAFVLFRKIADEHVAADPETSQRAPFVAKALIALAGYLRTGIAEIDLAPNSRRAADYLHHAAVFFGDKDAQLELARTYLNADGPGDDTRRGLHYLSALTEQGYAPAQATLADLFWRGRHVKKDERRALALVTLAVENAPPHERIWIEDTYATVFCAAAQPTREAAGALAARWRKMFAEPAPVSVAYLGLGGRDLAPERQCASGETVAIAPRAVTPPPATTGVTAAAAPPSIGPSPDLVPLKSGTAPVGFRAAGIVETAAKK
jgi:exopolysaccharide production negative regulator